MNFIAELVNPMLLASLFSSLLMFGLLFYFWQSRSESRARSEVRKRLDISNRPASSGAGQKSSATKAASAMAKRVAKKTDTDYSLSDPKNKRKIQVLLMQAGFMQKSAVGYFLAARLGLGMIGIATGTVTAIVIYPDMAITNKLLVIVLFTLQGYFLPNIYVNNQAKKRQETNREGFPDVMDLMVVAAEAGLTTEASIERIADEVSITYPVLSEQLHITATEMRAGKAMDEALHFLFDRLGLEEVQGFATMIQQSKELGT